MNREVHVRICEGRGVRFPPATRRRLARDSAPSSRPPSSDGSYTKPMRRSSRGRSGRRPDKQPGKPGTTLCQVPDPDEVVVCEPGRCADCGGELAEAERVRVAARQVFDVPPPPPPYVTEYRVVSAVSLR